MSKDVPFKTENEAKEDPPKQAATPQECLTHAEAMLMQCAEQAGYWAGYKKRLLEEMGRIAPPTKG